MSMIIGSAFGMDEYEKRREMKKYGEIIKQKERDIPYKPIEQPYRIHNPNDDTASYKKVKFKHANKFHKGTDPVKPFGYKRDILFGEKGLRSTGHLKDF